MNNITIIQQNSVNPIIVENNTEFNAISTPETITINVINSNGDIEIFDLNQWQNDYGEFKATLINSNSYNPDENIYYAYNGNSNLIEYVRYKDLFNSDESKLFVLPAIYFLQSDRFYYTVTISYEKREGNMIDLINEPLPMHDVVDDDYIGHIYLNKIPYSHTYRDILQQLYNKILEQETSNYDNNISNYVKIKYSLFKINSISGTDEYIKDIDVSLIIIPDDTKIIGIKQEYNENSVSNDNDITCLPRESIVTAENGSYKFDDKPIANHLFGINKGQYLLKNVPKNHPMAVIYKTLPNISYTVDNSNPIAISVVPRPEPPHNYEPASPDYYFKFFVGTQQIYLSNSLDSVHSAFLFMRNRSYLFKTSVEYSFYFYTNLKNNQIILEQNKSIYIHIPGDLGNNSNDYLECGVINYTGNTPQETIVGKEVMRLLVKDVDSIKLDFYYGDIILNIQHFDIQDTLSLYCFNHGYMGSQDRIFLDKNCSKPIYNLYNIIPVERVHFDITNKANDELDDNGYPITQTINNGYDFKGSHYLYKPVDKLSQLNLIRDYRYLFVDLNYTVDYNLQGNIFVDPAVNYPFKLLLDNSDQQTISNSGITINDQFFSSIDSLDINFLRNNFKNYFTSVKIMGVQITEYSYYTTIPLLFRNSDPGMPHINYTYFKFINSAIDFLHMLNINFEVGEENQLLGYEAANHYNPIYRNNATYNFIIQVLGNNYYSINFNSQQTEDIDDYIKAYPDDNNIEYLYISYQKLNELGLQVIQNDQVGDIVINNPTLKIYKAYFTDQEDVIYEIPDVNNLIYLVKNSGDSYLNLRLAFSYENADNLGSIVTYPTQNNIGNINNFFKLINSAHQPQNDEPGVTFQLLAANNSNGYPIPEVVNHHNMFQNNFNFPSGTSTYCKLDLLDLGDIELFSNHNANYNTILNMNQITYYNEQGQINNLSISQYTYEITDSNNENNHINIDLDPIYKFNLDKIKIFMLLKDSLDIKCDIRITSDFMSSEQSLLNGLITLDETANMFMYKDINLINNLFVNYFDKVKIKVIIKSHITHQNPVVLGLLNHLFLNFSEEPIKLTGISSNIYSSYQVYKNLNPKPELAKFTDYMTNNLLATLNQIQTINTPITINNTEYSSYKISLVDSNFSINNFTQLGVPLLFLKNNDNVQNIQFNGVSIDLQSNKNDIISIGSGLNLIVLSNDSNLMSVKVADLIDLITDINSFFSVLISENGDGSVDEETKERAYNKLNDIYTDDSSYNNEFIRTCDKPSIDVLINNANNFTKNSDRFTCMYVGPVLNDDDSSNNILCIPNVNEVIKYNILVFFPTTKNNNTVVVKIEGINYTFIQKGSKLIINNRDLLLGEYTVFNRIRFDFIGEGSTFILISKDTSSNTVSTGIGGDPYISNLQGIKYKLPSGNNCYNYIFNNEDNEHNQFMINFETHLLEGSELKELNEFVLDQLVIKQNLKSRNDASIWLFKNGLKLDMNACFMKKIYIKNGKNELLFDLDTFKFYDNKGIELNELPYRFKVISSSDFKMNSIISEHIKLNNHMPFKGIRIQTQTKSYGIVTIELMKYRHPQIRNNININFQYNPIKTNSIGGIVKNRNYYLDTLLSYPNLNSNKLLTNTVSEIYVSNTGNIKLEEIKQ